MSDFTGRLAPGETNFITSRPLTQAEADQLYFPIDGDLGNTSFGVSWSQVQQAINQAIIDNQLLSVPQGDERYLGFDADFGYLFGQLQGQYAEWLESQQAAIEGIGAGLLIAATEAIDDHRNEIPAHNWNQISEKPDFDNLYRPIQTPIDWEEIINVPTIATDWDSIADKPTEFPPTTHNHLWSQLTNPPEAATRWASWTEVTNKPTAFPPSTHNHTWGEVTGKPAQATRWPTWEEVTAKPDFDVLYRPMLTPIDWGEIINVPTFATDWGSITGKPSLFNPAVHAPTHAPGSSDPITPGMIGAEVSGAAAAAIAAHLAASNPHPQYAGGGTGGTTTYNVIRSSPAFVEEFDDFLSTNALHKLGWSASNNNGWVGAELGNRFPGTHGVFTLGVNGTSQSTANFSHLRLGNFPVIPQASEGYTNIEISAVVGLANAVPTEPSWISSFGLLDTGAGVGTNFSILISARFFDNAYNWVAIWRSGSGSPNFHVITPVVGTLLTKVFALKIKIDCQNNQITFEVDGVTHQVNIASADWQFGAMSPIFVVQRAAVTADTLNRAFWVDKYLFRKNVVDELPPSSGIVEVDWVDVLNKPPTFPPSPHTHLWGEITNPPETATRWSSWDEVTSKPTTFAPSSHTHAWSQITSIPATASRWPSWTEVTSKPDFATLYRGLTDPIDWADIINIPPASGGDVTWADVLNKPTLFPPTAHGHGWSEITSIPATASRWPSWTEVTSKPAAFSPSAHASTHAVGSTDPITPAMIGARAAGSVPWGDLTSVPATATRWPAFSEVTSAPATATRWPTWAEVTSKPTTFAPSAHTHPWGDITGSPLSTAVTYGSLAIAGVTGTYAGIQFSGCADPRTTFMVRASDGLSGLWTQTGWKWYFDQNGALTAGTIPWARITGQPVQATRWPAFSEVTSAPATATRWPTWAEVTGKPVLGIDEQDQTLVLTSPYTATTGVGAIYRRIGKQVFLEGKVERPSGSTSAAIVTMPAGFRPVRNLDFFVPGYINSNLRHFLIRIGTGGGVSIIGLVGDTLGSAAIAGLSLNPMSFFIP
jgi:hypothetical protein